MFRQYPGCCQLRIDFSKLARGQVPPNLFAQVSRLPDEWSISQANSRTYGEWPNERTQTQVPGAGSLVGAHTIKGNYSPQINFTLDEDQDFLGPLNLTTNAKAPGGWVNLGWNLVGNAEAYLATALGGDGDTVVLWTSSETQAAGFAMPDYLTSPDISRLVGNKSLMGPTQKTCAGSFQPIKGASPRPCAPSEASLPDIWAMAY